MPKNKKASKPAPKPARKPAKPAPARKAPTKPAAPAKPVPPPPARKPAPPPPKPAAPTAKPLPAWAITSHVVATKPPAPPVVQLHLPLAAKPTEATHLEYSRPPTYKGGVMVDPGVTIVVPANCYGDFSSFKVGKVRWGRLVHGEDFRPDPANLPDSDEAPPPAAVDAPRPPAPGKPRPPGQPPAPPAPRAPKQPGTGPKREGVCAFIDDLIMEGGRTREQIRDLVLAQFPGRDPKATLTTVGIRPTHIRAKGLTPLPFAK